MIKYLNVFGALIVTSSSIIQVNGHGYMFEPPGRSTMWRWGFHTPKNYDDNGINCGGFATQWQKNHGKCGICGDAYDNSRPRENELGGKYGEGIISRIFSKTIPIIIRITAPHKGFFTFSICNLDEFEETEGCFKPVHLADGTTKMRGITKAKDYKAQLQIPPELHCNHCVLRWHYKAGNNVNQCRSGRYSRECGPQETFRNCADITII